jgi:hypothetical protein
MKVSKVSLAIGADRFERRGELWPSLRESRERELAAHCKRKGAARKRSPAKFHEDLSLCGFNRAAESESSEAA